MGQAIVLARHGGAEELTVRDVAVAAPGPGELRLRQTAIGVNFHDVYVRTGLYKTLTLPGIPGIEGVGVVEAVGDGVKGWAAGDRVGYVTGAYGAYASHRLLPAWQAIRLPDWLGDIDAAATLLRVMTANVLVTQAHVVRPGQFVLVHAAAGGVGQLLCGWARALGASVIGTVSTDEKAEIAIRSGAHHVVRYKDEDVLARVMQITGDQGVAAAYDAVGQQTFATSLAALGYQGMLVNYGQSSGPVEPFSPSALAVRSLGVVRPIVFHYLRNADQVAALSQPSFAALQQGFVRPPEATVLDFGDIAHGHRLLEAGASPGAVVLTV